MADLNLNPEPTKPEESPVFRWLLPAALRRGAPGKNALIRRAALLWGLIALGALGWLNLLPRFSSVLKMEPYQQAAALIIILTLGLLLNYALETWRQRKAAKTAPPPPPKQKSKTKAAPSPAPPGPTPTENLTETPAPHRKPGPTAKKKDRGGRPRRKK